MPERSRIVTPVLALELFLVMVMSRTDPGDVDVHDVTSFSALGAVDIICLCWTFSSHFSFFRGGGDDCLAASAPCGSLEGLSARSSL